MTRKDYDAVARIIHAAKETDCTSEQRAMVFWIQNKFSDYFEGTNARFSAERFSVACRYDKPEWQHALDRITDRIAHQPKVSR